MQPPGDHEMQHQEEIPIETDHDALAEPAKAGEAAVGRRRDRGIDRAEQERAREPHPFEGRACDAGLERLDVDGDVGQLRHPRMERRRAAYTSGQG